MLSLYIPLQTLRSDVLDRGKAIAHAYITQKKIHRLIFWPSIETAGTNLMTSTNHGHFFWMAMETGHVSIIFSIIYYSTLNYIEWMCWIVELYIYIYQVQIKSNNISISFPSLNGEKKIIIRFWTKTKLNGSKPHPSCGHTTTKPFFKIKLSK
jgi:hypothetical protein